MAAVSITVRDIPAADNAKLAKLAKKNGRSKSAEIRLAINQHVSRGDK